MAAKSTTSTKAKKTPVKKNGTTKSPARAATTKAGGTRAAAAKASPLQVEALMTSTPQICRAGDHLASAAAGMWTADCGSLPVLNDDAKLVGWITDRDISMALAMQPVRASEMEVGQVMNGPVHTCKKTDRVSVALAIMTDKQVRRLAVLDETEELVGVLSIADLVQAATPRATAAAPALADVFEALRGIGRPYEVTTTA